MEANQKPTKKELKEQKHLEILDREKQQKRQNIITWIVISIASLLFLVFFGYLIMQGKKNNSAQTANIKISAEDHVRGNNNAKLTLVEFSDFQCPACSAMEPYTEKVLKDHPNQVRLIYKEFPLSGHKNAVRAAQAAEAAGKQGKFWEMHDILFSKQNEWEGLSNPTDQFKSYAQSLVLDVNKFSKDIDSSEVMDKINRNLDEGNSLQINGTPTFYLNNQLLTLSSFNDLEKAVSEKLK